MVNSIGERSPMIKRVEEELKKGPLGRREFLKKSVGVGAETLFSATVLGAVAETYRRWYKKNQAAREAYEKSFEEVREKREELKAELKQTIIEAGEGYEPSDSELDKMIDQLKKEDLPEE